MMMILNIQLKVVQLIKYHLDMLLFIIFTVCNDDNVVKNKDKILEILTKYKFKNIKFSI